MSVPETWTEHTTANLERSQAARAASRKIRNDIEHCLNASTTSIREFWGASCLNISQRAQETMEARNQLQTKLSKVNREISDIELSMEYIKKCIADKQNPLKITQTRLDLRKHRPNLELCRDEAHDQLIREAAELEEIVDHLIRQLAASQTVHQDLLRARSQLEADLAAKSNSLFIDREKCLGLRKTFPMTPFAIVSS
ncbi:Tektin-3 [Fasciolopsis buskii]|uniref:Tektin n=1 Tax=Fasciolopsis buskii TaxID=27845 RepID=A0A8E0VQ96_9TREM|nr:Tektin-3 [Fasciolopsis buski]